MRNDRSECEGNQSAARFHAQRTLEEVGRSRVRGKVSNAGLARVRRRVQGKEAARYDDRVGSALEGKESAITYHEQNKPNRRQAGATQKRESGARRISYNHTLSGGAGRAR